MFTIDLTGKVAWVTGGSRGIGKATAIALAQAGCDVAITFRSQEDEAKQVAASIEALDRKVCVQQLDVTDAAACQTVYDNINHALGKVDILVNNAGVVSDNLFMMLEADDWQKVLDTNVMGPVNVTKTVIKDMMMRRWGRVINMSSVAASKGGRGQANYAASKGAIEAMTRSLAVELAKRNITVNCIAPGVIETEMSAEVRKLGHEEIMSRQLIKRYGRAEEIAAWVVFLASNHGEFITGEVLAINGGLA